MLPALSRGYESLPMDNKPAHVRIVMHLIQLTPVGAVADPRTSILMSRAMYCQGEEDRCLSPAIPNEAAILVTCTQIASPAFANGFGKRKLYLFGNLASNGRFDPWLVNSKHLAKPKYLAVLIQQQASGPFGSALPIPRSNRTKRAELDSKGTGSLSGLR